MLPADDKQQVASALEEDAQVMSNTRLEKQLATEPPQVRAEVIRINTEARPIALHVALLVPPVAGLLGAANALRMRRLADPAPADSDTPVLG